MVCRSENGDRHVAIAAAPRDVDHQRHESEAVDTGREYSGCEKAGRWTLLPTIPMRMRSFVGGMSVPVAPAVASSATAERQRVTCARSVGIVTLPMAAASADEEPGNAV